MPSYRSNLAANSDPIGAGLPNWPRYDPQKPQRIGFLAGGDNEQISSDAYAEEHHCALWDALAAKAS